MVTLASLSQSWMLLGGAFLFCSLVMLALWGLATRHRDASCVDVAWAGLLGVLAIAYGALGEGLAERRALIGAVGGVWGLRLAWHLFRDRIWRAKEEDGRYQQLRAEWGERATSKFFVFFQAQGLLDVLLSIPFLVAAMTPAPLALTDYAGGALWLVGIVGESIADAQLAAWRRNPANRGRTCRAGLWKFSRHPNYFFEWLMWCAYAVIAAGPAVGWSWLVWLAPAMMLLLITKVTGIPPTEARALRTRGEDYRAYQRTTSAFVPWFPSAEGGRA